MSGVSKSAAVLIALFASIPIAVFITLGIWELFILVNGGAALNTSQTFQTLFAGFAFGLAVFTFLYAAQTRSA